MIAKIINRILRLLRFFGYTYKAKGNKIYHKLTEKIEDFNIEEMIDRHFETWSSKNHPCYKTLKKTLLHLHKESQDLIILETGSAAHGTKSTILFDNFSNYSKKKINILTCDIKINPYLDFKNSISQNTQFYCEDSVKFLERFSKKYVNTNRNKLIYLDSFDLDFINPYPAAFHGLKEFIAIEPLLNKNTLLLIDDTPKSLEFINDEKKKAAAKNFYNKKHMYPGKGMFIYEILKNRIDVELILHEYQLLYIFK